MLPARRMLAGVYLAGPQARRHRAGSRSAEALPTQATGFALEAEVEAQQRNWSGAQAAYRTALQKQPSTETATKLHATLLMAGKPDEAQKLASGWLAEHPKDAAFPLLSGRCRLVQEGLGRGREGLSRGLAGSTRKPIGDEQCRLAAHQARQGRARCPWRRRLFRWHRAHATARHPGLGNGGQQPTPKALELQRQTLKLAPQDPQLKLTLARLFIQSAQSPKRGLNWKTWRNWEPALPITPK
jgi:hypothetical protein